MAASAHAIFCSAGVADLERRCAEIAGARTSERTDEHKILHFIFPFSLERRPKPRGYRRAAAGSARWMLRHGPAAGLAWIDVTPVAPARANLPGTGTASRKGTSFTLTPSPRRLLGKWLKPETKNTSDRYAQRDVDGVVEQTPPVRIAGRIASNQTEAACAVGRCCWNARVEAQQICDRPGRSSRSRDWREHT